ncbi:aminotransferase class I/II-fold pyridoxal phosphate-dependent enzyme [Seonamhaeicola maritimus]|uniref:GDP-perosamine synthase n=1 Tax=Seonamhaeicola maritimus TaxID=2591822 RepID=A0A5C7GII4_9FLAO|nr:aminotransferase class I/II-fold pyridoxal phosphate-dependent enzyme [Seonamhaeicola maritimus]TXG37161.1 aminotransferase class I/II-fold pyridoxal phosphate-dependent enzyme [Seonamhaeicola maritimus]
MSSRIRLSSPHMGGGELKYIKEAIDTNWVAPVGANISNFEKDLENYLGEGNHVTALSSGTAAIHLALILAGVEKGDEVICQSLTFAASAFPILYQGAIPVFVDSERETWNMCPNYLEEAIKDRIKKGIKPKVIILVHIFGMPAKMDEIIRISKKYGIPIIEDAAEALGSEYNGQKCGTLGDFGIFSFNGNKVITTSGGGALVTKSKPLKEKTIYLATQAKDNLPYYQHSQLGFNYRMSNISAGIGRGQMEVLDGYISIRRSNNKFYYNLFKPYKFIEVFSEYNSKIKSNHWLTCILLKKDEPIEDVKRLFDLFKTNNIESKLMWKPLHMQPIFSSYSFYGNRIAESIFEQGLCLPSGSNLTKTEKETIAEVVLMHIDD